MRHPSPKELGFSLAWIFSEVLPGHFERDREEVEGKRFPIVGPLAPDGRYTLPKEDPDSRGPFVYLLCDRTGSICYVGKATEANLTSPIERWIRPDLTGLKEYWAHGTNKKSKSTIERIAEGIASGLGPYALHFASYARISNMLAEKRLSQSVSHDVEVLPPSDYMSAVERVLIHRLQPAWNGPGKKSPPPPAMAALIDAWLSKASTGLISQ